MPHCYDWDKAYISHLHWLAMGFLFEHLGAYGLCYNAGFKISNWMHWSVGQVYCKIHSSKCTIHLSQIYKANATYVKINKANLRDLIAATGLVILLKFDPNHRFFSPFDLEIWCMTLNNDRAPLLYYTKLCASCQIHRWIKIGVTVRKRSIWVKIGDFLSRVTLKFDGWPWKTIGHLLYVASSFVHHFTAIRECKL